MTAEDAGAESDVQSINSDAPPAWNSDDEPPEDHEGDENNCSRDGAVKKLIRKVGKGLERPGQNDIVTLRFSTLQLDGPPINDVPDKITVEMGSNKLPLAVEFAVKNMRVGEVAEVRAPAAYSSTRSPLCGRQLRTQPGVLPKTGKVKRKLRFLPAAPKGLAEQAKADLLKFRRAQEAAAGAGAGGPAPASPPMFRARVELLGFECILALTEDRSVTKRILHTGSSRRRRALQAVLGPGKNKTSEGILIRLRIYFQHLISAATSGCQSKELAAKLQVITTYTGHVATQTCNSTVCRVSCKLVNRSQNPATTRSSRIDNRRTTLGNCLSHHANSAKSFGKSLAMTPCTSLAIVTR